MPNLDAFDDEFGREHTVVLNEPQRNTGFRLSTIIGLALAAGIISALALGWPNASGPTQSKLQADASSATAGSENMEAAIARLAREVEALKIENGKLRQAQQQASETIAALQGTEQDSHPNFVAWYSDLGTLTYGIPSQSEAAAAGG